MRIVWIIKLERSQRTAAIVAVRAPAEHGVSSYKSFVCFVTIFEDRLDTGWDPTRVSQKASSSSSHPY